MRRLFFYYPKFLIATLFFGLSMHAGPAEDPSYKERNERFKDHLANGTAQAADCTGVDPNYPMFSDYSDTKGTTLVVYAAQQGKWDVVKKLIDLPNNDINKAPEGGSYKGLPLQWYLAQSNQEVLLNQIIEKYRDTIDLNVGKWDGDTQLDSAFGYMIHNKMRDALRRAILLASLNKMPIDFNRTIKIPGQTHLWLLAKNLPDLVRSVVDKFTDLNLNAGPEGQNTVFSFMCTSLGRDWTAVGKMLEKAQPNILLPSGNIWQQNGSLMLAVASKQWDIANLMIDRIPKDVLQKVSPNWEDYSFLVKLSLDNQWQIITSLLPTSNSDVIPSGMPKIGSMAGRLIYSILYPKTVFPLETDNYQGYSLSRQDPAIFSSLQLVDKNYRELARPSEEGLVRLLRDFCRTQSLPNLPDAFLVKLYNAYTFALSQQKLFKIAEELQSNYIESNGEVIESDFCVLNDYASCRKNALQTLMKALKESNKNLPELEAKKAHFLVELRKIDLAHFNEKTVTEAFKKVR